MSNAKPKITLSFEVRGAADRVEIRIDQTPVPVAANGKAVIQVEVGRHFLQYVALGSPGDKFSLRLQPERGQPWEKTFHLPADGTVVGSKKFNIDDDDWPGPRLRLR